MHMRSWNRSNRGGRRRSSGSAPGGSLWRIVTPLLALLLLVVACSEEGQQQVSDALENVSTTAPLAPDSDAPEDTAPEPEAPAPEPEAPEPQPEAPAVEEDGLSDSDWVLLILLGIAAVALIGAAITAAGRHSASKSARKNAVATRLSDIVGSCRWIHDSGSMEVLLVQDPSQIQSAWAPVRTRMMDAESQISTLAANTSDDDLQRSLHDLGQSLNALRSAEEAYVTAKARAVGLEGQELLRTSYQTVIDRRREFQMSIEPVATEMRYR